MASRRLPGLDEPPKSIVPAVQERKPAETVADALERLRID